MKDLTTDEAAELMELTGRRIRAKIKQGHFPGAYPELCRCKKTTLWFIPESDIKKDQARKDRRPAKTGERQAKGRG